MFISSQTHIRLKGSDPEAGMNRIEYSVDGSDPKEYTEAFTLEKEGYSAIDFTGFDNVDNTSSKSFGVKVDNTGPEISNSFGTSRLRTEGKLSVYPSHTVLFLNATDRVVGFQRLTYSLNGAPSKESSGMLEALPKGKNELLVKAFDKLGNSNESTLQFIIE
jgi:hypothetical protein